MEGDIRGSCDIHIFDRETRALICSMPRQTSQNIKIALENKEEYEKRIELENKAFLQEMTEE